MTRTIRWGIIGAGDVTEVKSGPALQKADNSALVAVMRRDGAKAADYAQRHGVPRWYNDAAALIHDPEVDVVYIATPPHVHQEYTLQAAEAGKPVYVEKPMARTFAECQAMIDACAAADVPLWVAYYRRAQPRFRKVKALLDAGAIGAVRSVQIALYQRPGELDLAALPWRYLPEIAGGGLFVDLASHTLDLLDYFLGPIQAVQSIAANQMGRYPAEDQVVASFAFESGALGNGVWCFSADAEADEVTLTGTRGQIDFATFAEVPVRLVTEAGVETFTIPRPEHVQQPLIQTIVDELNGVGTCPSTGVSGARTAWVVDQALAGYRANARGIKWVPSATGGSILQITVDWNEMTPDGERVLVASDRYQEVVGHLHPGMRALLIEPGDFEVEAIVEPEDIAFPEGVKRWWYGTPDWSTRRDL